MDSTPSPYQEFFHIQPRLTGKKEIAVLKGDRFEDFLAVLALDETFKVKHRVFFIILACGGLRVSEGLNLKKEDFFWHENNGKRYLMFKTGVLKKRGNTEYRYCRIHPSVQDFVWDVISTMVGKKLFDFTSRWSLRLAQSYFAIDAVCNHTFRHSAISYLLFEEELSREKVSKLVHVSSKIIDHYAHLDEKRVLMGLFDEDSD